MNENFVISHEDKDYKHGASYRTALEPFGIKTNKDFVFMEAMDDYYSTILIPCYKTNKITKDGDIVYQPAITLAETKAFLNLRNKMFYTREDKLLVDKFGNAIDKCVTSYGFSVGSVKLSDILDFYKYYEISGAQKEGIAYIKSQHAKFSSAGAGNK